MTRGRGQKLPILRRHSLWTAPYMLLLRAKLKQIYVCIPDTYFPLWPSEEEKKQGEKSCTSHTYKAHTHDQNGISKPA